MSNANPLLPLVREVLCPFCYDPVDVALLTERAEFDYAGECEKCGATMSLEVPRAERP